MDHKAGMVLKNCLAMNTSGIQIANEHTSIHQKTKRVSPIRMISSIRSHTI